MLAVERRNIIIKKLKEDKRVIVSELSKDFNVSKETIRRDLDKLCKDGMAVKSHGGAVLSENNDIELPFNIRKQRNVEGKQKIAELAAGLIEDGDHIILDPSTTAVFIAKAIKHKKHLTVITNSIEILIELSDVRGWNIISSGGTLKTDTLALVGSKTLESFRTYNADKCFFSCKGVHMERGITDGNEQLSEAKKTMLKTAKTGILVADYSKFDTIAFSRITNIDGVDVVITDMKPHKKWLELFERMDIQCLY